nr:hypothetical protein [Deltaproteobacteria bacterium]
MKSPKKRTMPEPTRSASVAQRDEQRPSGPARRVSAISIERLFGQHSYRAPASGTLGDIAILYGDNGSGKTTLLKLAFRLLSSAPNRGHRTALYKIPFAKLEVLLSDGTTVTARRNESLLGPLQLDIAAPGQQVVSGLYSHAIEERFESRSFEEQYISALKSIGLTTYYLTDTRELISDALAHPDHRSERELADWLA